MGGAGGVAAPPPPSYQQLAAASRLASLLGSHQTSTTTSSTSPSSQSQEHQHQSKKRPGNQFSIDELLRQDDKKGKFETDSKSISVAEVDENEETNHDDSPSVKLESEYPAE